MDYNDIGQGAWMMCGNEGNALTLAGLLSDPLTLMLMRSDGVSEREFSALLLRVQDCLLARHGAGAQAETVKYARNA